MEGSETFLFDASSGESETEISFPKRIEKSGKTGSDGISSKLNNGTDRRGSGNGELRKMRYWDQFSDPSIRL
jgi:hypothetical protein